MKALPAARLGLSPSVRFADTSPVVFATGEERRAILD
jgi:hypothetical protein